MTLILTTPISSGTTVVSGNITNDQIPPQTTLTVDSASILDRSTIKWIVELKNATTGAIIAQEILAVRQPSSVQFTRYGIVGDLLPHLVDVVSNLAGTALDLKITNSSTTDIYYVNAIR